MLFDVICQNDVKVAKVSGFFFFKICMPFQFYSILIYFKTGPIFDRGSVSVGGGVDLRSGKSDWQ